MQNIIEVQELIVGYERALLSNLHFSIAPAEILVVLGTNGVGKSTLMKTLLGILPAMGGRIGIQTKNIGLMPQLRAVEDSLPIATEDFLGLFQWFSSQWKSEVIDFLELGPYLNRSLAELSCGLWQRVNFAQSLSSKPALLFLDEPTQGLDIDWQKAFYEYLLKYTAEYGAAVCCISHDTLAISRCAHKVLCLDHQPGHDLVLKTRAESLVERSFVLYQHHRHCQHTEGTSC